MKFKLNSIYTTDVLKGLKNLPSESVDSIVTSPPYWALRDYDMPGQIGLEKTYEEYIAKLIEIFTEAKRVLKNTGTLWVNIGDTYGGSNCGYGDDENRKNMQNVEIQKYYSTTKGKPLASKVFQKSLIGIPQRFSAAMIDSGWLLRNTIIWHKPNAMPESTKDRFTNDFEYLFFFTRAKNYFFVQQFEAFQSNEYDLKRMKNGRKEYKGKWSNTNNKTKIKETQRAFVAGYKQGRNKRSVWGINTKSFKDAHFAVFPEELIETPIQAGCPKNGIILDPFMGSGTTAVVAKRFNRNYIGFELNPTFVKIAEKRINGIGLNGMNNQTFDQKMKLKRKISKAKLKLFANS